MNFDKVSIANLVKLYKNVWKFVNNFIKIP